MWMTWFNGPTSERKNAPSGENLTRWGNPSSKAFSKSGVAPGLSV